jgi:DNA-binding LytR/AlgR family response regulator
MYTIILNKERDVMESFESSFINTALVLLLPYIVLWFYFGWRESTKRLEKIENEDDEEQDIPGNITFNDEKGTLRLSVLCSDLLYIESSENYVVINYSNKGKVKRYLLRNTLKNIEGALERSRIVRCHRSYLVNLDRAKVIRRDKEGLFIELDTDGVIDIPVSKSYQKKVSETFLAHSFRVLN